MGASVGSKCAAPADPVHEQMCWAASGQIPSLPNRRLSRFQDETPQKLFASDESLKDKLVGVVVTLFEGSSYDEMFREVRPTSAPGERISTYALQCGDVGRLHDLLASTSPVPQEHGSWRDLVEDVRQVPSDSVVFNWECCSGCGDHSFPCGGNSHCQQQRQAMRFSLGARPSTHGSSTMRFMGFALQSGFTVMCSDFSLKSLLHEWSEEQLGPNPFIRVGSCDHQIRLEFIPEDLQNDEVPQQLQVVGELCAEQGRAVMSAMSDTIVYTINPDRKKTDRYDLKVLTVATEFGGIDAVGVSDAMKCSVGDGPSLKRGFPGHVTLTYAEGGQLVTSMGHWIELTRIDASAESVFRVAMHNFGGAEADMLRQEYAMQATDGDRAMWVQSNCHRMTTQSVPTRMKCRTKF